MLQSTQINKLMRPVFCYCDNFYCKKKRRFVTWSGEIPPHYVTCSEDITWWFQPSLWLWWWGHQKQPQNGPAIEMHQCIMFEKDTLCPNELKRDSTVATVIFQLLAFNNQSSMSPCLHQCVQKWTFLSVTSKKTSIFFISKWIKTQEVNAF